MSLNATLKNALEGIAPTEADAYQGKAPTYITFGYSTFPTDFGDNAPSHERHLVQVHLLAPVGVNVLTKRRAIKKALFGAGGTWASYTNISDKEGQHHVFECEFITGIGGE